MDVRVLEQLISIFYRFLIDITRIYKFPVPIKVNILRASKYNNDIFVNLFLLDYNKIDLLNFFFWRNFYLSLTELIVLAERSNNLLFALVFDNFKIHQVEIQ